ncbi:MAG: acyl-ACP--UDP-N-acetylglucosamine O-acyltransferase [Sulfurovum sp.]|nr:acyl-ACP--UDP-N-acetylglucosamine O-acyltransferase [Sulfurovum sp.]
MNKKYQTSIIEAGALVGEGTKIGNACFIGKNVVIGKNNMIDSLVVIDGNTTIGDNNHIATRTVLGTTAQDIRSDTDSVGLKIGNYNDIGTAVFISVGTTHGGKLTVIKNHNTLMDRIHIGHDVQMGSHCLMEENSALGGHVTVDNYVTFGKSSAVHQFVNIGEYAVVSNNAALTQDVPPYCVAQGNRAKIIGLNIDILNQHFSKSEVSDITDAYHWLFETSISPKEKAVKALNERQVEVLKKFYSSIADSKRGIPFTRKENVN